MQTIHEGASGAQEAESPARTGTGDPVIVIEDDRTGMRPEVFKRAIADNLYYLQGKVEMTATPHDQYMALAYTLRDRIMHRWFKTQEAYYKSDAKRVYYLSAEFLMGRYTYNNILNLKAEPELRRALAAMGLELADLLEVEPDAGLGNGGLGRLAACYLDSLATLGLPAYGCGIRYEFGIFDQEIRNGYQVEHPDHWLRFGNPWEIVQPDSTVGVHFGGHTEMYTDEAGRVRTRWSYARTVLGVPYDTPVMGFDCNNANTLRLWQAKAHHEFDLEEFNEGDYLKAVEEKTISENISKVLYPNDNSSQGRELRLRQQYFFVACSLHDIVRRYLKSHRDFTAFSDKVAIQLNDTHPTVAIPELMRILVDLHGLGWDEAWRITVRTFGYTNHTLLSEALETWPVELFERILPRHLEIIYEINRRFLEDLRHAFPGDDDRVRRMSLIGEAPTKHVRMAFLACVGSHSVNGVAALHTELLKHDVLGDFYQVFPDRFNNKTNGVTPRRWLLACNRRLAEEITRRIGPRWGTHLDELEKLVPLAEDPGFRQALRDIKRANKDDLARHILATTGVHVDVDSMFDVQVKRLHEYKRQHLNVLHIIARYLRVKKTPHAPVVPRTFIFGAKAAPGYRMAKLIIKLINSVADVMNRDQDVAGRYRVVFLPNYRVSLAEKIFPASDLSEQISTAGKEASGTGNMKFSMNGALTIGTLDGANVEIREAVGPENFFLFGLKAHEVAFLKQHGYDPGAPARENAELAQVLELLYSGHFSPEQPDLFRPLVDDLIHHDPYMVLRDFESYVHCQEQVDALWCEPDEWARRAAINIGHTGFFSSDRAVAEYARDIWNLEPVPVTIEPYRQEPFV